MQFRIWHARILTSKRKIAKPCPPEPVAFTEPRAARVGLTEREAKAVGMTHSLNFMRSSINNVFSQLLTW